MNVDPTRWCNLCGSLHAGACAARQTMVDADGERAERSFAARRQLALDLDEAQRLDEAYRRLDAALARIKE